MRVLVAALLSALSSAFFLPAALAQTYPSKPLRIIVPYAPGGANDLIARALAPGLQESLGQPVIVENRVGAGGGVGVEAASRAAPDGHTLLVTATGSITINVHLSKLAYDPVKDLVAVTMLASSPLLLAVHPALPVNSVSDLIGYLRGKPNGASYSTAGVGSLASLAGELLTGMTGTSAVSVPYKGGAPAAAAIASGEVQFGISDPVALQPFIRSGKVRALAITDARRSSISAGLPTIGESVPGYDASSWVALFAPAGTPASVIARLNPELARLVKDSSLRERLLNIGIEPVTNSSEEMNRMVRADAEKWRKVIKDAGIKRE